VSEVPLYEGAFFRLAEFRCPAGHDRWRRENVIGEFPVAAFPLTSVVIRHERREAQLANANHVVFYRGRERYRRVLHDPRGDHCIFVGLAPEFAKRLLDTNHVKADEIPFGQGPSPAASYLRLRVVAQSLRSGYGESLAVEEAVCEALDGAVRAAVAVHGPRRSARPSTELGRARLAEEAKALLTERATRHDSLATLAARLHTSEFHLARAFRASTGFTLHRYRTELRLRHAVERLGKAEDLTMLAIELGFNSHSHFTSAFRSAFGVPPSTVRRVCGRRGRYELGRILKATDVVPH